MSYTRKIMISFYFFGIFMGIIFPFYAMIFVDFKPGKTIYFVIGCLVAGFAIGVFNFIIYKKIVGRVLKSLSDHFFVLAQGDLSKPFVIHSNDEFGQMGQSFEKMRNNLSTSLNTIKGNAFRLETTSSDLARSTQETKQISDQVAQKITEVASGAGKQAQHNSQIVQLVHQMEQESTDSCKQIDELVKQSRVTTQIANEGRTSIHSAIENLHVITETIQTATDSIQTLGRRSEEISEIVAIIKDITNQTSLLALNAAIEAARAGEHGRGFSIVANEVHKLADGSKSAAQKITELITSIQLETLEKTRTMNDDLLKISSQINIIQTGGTAVSSIVEQVESTEKTANQVQHMLVQLNMDAKQIKESMDEISHIIAHTAANSEEVSMASKRQFQIVNELAESASQTAKTSEKLFRETAKYELIAVPSMD